MESSINSQEDPMKKVLAEAVFEICSETCLRRVTRERVPRYQIVPIKWWYRIVDYKFHVKYIGKFYKSPDQALSALERLIKKPKRKPPVQVIDY
jgi:hypothetical protein